MLLLQHRNTIKFEMQIQLRKKKIKTDKTKQNKSQETYLKLIRDFFLLTFTKMANGKRVI